LRHKMTDFVVNSARPLHESNLPPSDQVVDKVDTVRERNIRNAVQHPSLLYRVPVALDGRASSESDFRETSGH
jgi:hypothetical protein